MSIKLKLLLSLGISLLAFQGGNSQNISAKEIVKHAYDRLEGKSNKSEMVMTIVRPAWKRTVSFKSWSKGKEFSIILITGPAKEKGQTFLKRKNEIWNWVPSISRLIKLPPSMMSQGWMGSDFSNDDLLKESSIVDDYHHTLLGRETVEGMDCYKIRLVPKPGTPVVWGSIIKWISKKDYHQLKSEFFDEDNYLVKTEIASKIKYMDDRDILTHYEIIPANEKGNRTLVDLIMVKFDIPIQDGFFSQQNMKTIR
ncbi:MAG: outer membrane lipoprotein-sorting protein [Bacteroidota bacterium]|nr:outer membrane lipoprotein-sorting protein [Bacteroidota bacterium]